MADTNQGITQEQQESLEEHLKSIKTDKTWDDIPTLSREVKEKIQQVYETPTLIQYLTIGETLEFIQPVITVNCRNGGGKTLSFGVPALEFAFRNKNLQMIKYQQNYSSQSASATYCPISIIIVNTIPLGDQIANTLAKICPEGVSIEVLNSESKIGQGGQILISTPHLLLKHLAGSEQESKEPKGINISNLCHVAIDEADNCLTSFQTELSRLLIFLKGSQDIVIQLVSATLSEQNINFIYKLFSFDITKDDDLSIIYPIELPWKLKGVTQYYKLLDGPSQDSFKNKYQICKELVEKVLQYNETKEQNLQSQVIIFFRKIQSIQNFEDMLSQDNVSWNHGSCAQKEKNKQIQLFRQGTYPIMLASPIMSRGIDISQIGLVINFDLPIDYQTKQFDSSQYLHNIGRTGRHADLGLAVTLFENIQSYEFASAIIKQKFEATLQKYDCPQIISNLEKIMDNNSKNNRVTIDEQKPQKQY